MERPERFEAGLSRRGLIVGEACVVGGRRRIADRANVATAAKSAVAFLAHAAAGRFVGAVCERFSTES